MSFATGGLLKSRRSFGRQSRRFSDLGQTPASCFWRPLNGRAEKSRNEKLSESPASWLATHGLNGERTRGFSADILTRELSATLLKQMPAAVASRSKQLD